LNKPLLAIPLAVIGKYIPAQVVSGMRRSDKIPFFVAQYSSLTFHLPVCNGEFSKKTIIF
jgi:hypothetical protein